MAASGGRGHGRASRLRGCRAGWGGCSCRRCWTAPRRTCRARSSARGTTGSARTSAPRWGAAALGVTVVDEPLDAVARAQAILDFTTPEASVALAALAAQVRAVHVIGTTGFTEDHLARFARRRAPRGHRAGRQHEPRREPAGAADPAGRDGAGRGLGHRGGRGASPDEGRRALGHRADAGPGGGGGARGRAGARWRSGAATA